MYAESCCAATYAGTHAQALTHAHAWHLDLNSTLRASCWSNGCWLKLCFVVSAASQGDRRVAKVGHGGLPGYFQWHLMVWCVLMSQATHTSLSVFVCMCVGGQAVTGAVLNTDNRVDVLRLRWCRQKLLSSPWLLEVARFATVHLSCTRDKTALVLTSLCNSLHMIAPLTTSLYNTLPYQQQQPVSQTQF